ncbi:GNAT family N-acetyltransferase [Streptomyces calidiresistens]|uniref:GNAT family N-acetyltransferase n=1 Tax=Streptomyces calidiresistens TaxID=1485586 RepID=UPI003F69088B
MIEVGQGSPVVVDRPDAKRYEATLDGERAGIADYIRTHELIVFTHTEVEPAMEGRGIGSALVRAALDDARLAQLKVLPVCPFFKGWIERHPDYADLLYDKRSRVTD